MSVEFDPYHEWLGIPPEEQPPSHYRLLGLRAFEDKATVIQNAADRQMAHLKTFQAGKRAAESQRLLNEIAAAKVCLLNPAKKAAYDETLRASTASAEVEEQSSGGSGLDQDFLDSLQSNKPEKAGRAAVLVKAKPLTAPAQTPPRKRTGGQRNKGPSIVGMIVSGLAAVAVAFGLYAWMNRKSENGPHLAKSTSGGPSSTQNSGDKPPKETGVKPAPAPLPPPLQEITGKGKVPEHRQEQPLSPTRPDLKIVVDRNDNEKATTEFHFANVPAPQMSTAVPAKFSVIDGKFVGLDFLNNGRLPSKSDDPWRNFWFTELGGRLLVDLQSATAIRQINTYSWHTGDRSPQIYKVYASDGLAAGFEISPKAETDPLKVGWTFLASVDTRTRFGEAGGQYGVSISSATGGIGKYRYLLFDMGATNHDTFYSRIDVIGADQKPAPAESGDGAIDLLRLIDPARDGKSGKWKREGNDLTVDSDPSSRKASALVLGYAFPTDYELTMTATQTGAQGFVAVSLPVNDRICHLTLSQHAASVLVLNDGEDIRKGVKPVKGDVVGDLFPPGTAVTISCSVHKTSVVVRRDGAALVSWDPSSGPLMPAGGRQSFIINAFGNSLRISRLEMRPTVPGPANGDRQHESTNQSPPAAKIPVPSPEDQAPVIAKVNEVYEVAKAKDASAKSALATKILAAGRNDRANQVEQFVLLRRASELAAEARDAEIACEAVDTMVNAGFDLPRPLELKVKMTSQILAKLVLSDGELHLKAVAAAAALAREAAENDTPDDTKDLLKMAQNRVKAMIAAAERSAKSLKVKAAHLRDPAKRAEAAESLKAAEKDVAGLNSALADLDACAELTAGPARRGNPPVLAVAPFDAATAQKHQARWAGYLREPAAVTNSVGMKLVLIPPGEFTMGSPRELTDKEQMDHKGDPWYQIHIHDETPEHRVRLTKPYWLGTTDVTQEQFERIMGRNPSAFAEKQMDPSEFHPQLQEWEVKQRLDFQAKAAGKDTRHNPVDSVTWEDACEFCRRLSEMPAERVAKRSYRLPTEAEWEYACRAGTTTRWFFGDDGAKLRPYVSQDAKAGWKTYPVEYSPVNAWGLYDMHGIVWQWCQDWFDHGYYASSPTDDPPGPPAGLSHVLRGGTWVFGGTPFTCRSAFRFCGQTPSRRVFLGFRVEMVATTSERQAHIAPKPPSSAVAPFDENIAKQHQAGWAEHLHAPVVETNSIGMKLVIIPPGEFMMGSPDVLVQTERKNTDEVYARHLDGELPRHRVRITQPFRLGMTQVTQAEYESVMGENPSQHKGDPNRPVEQVSWENAVEFCRRLSDNPREKAAKRRYVLPTEAQWEYACRAGTTTNFYLDDGEHRGEEAWLGENSGGQSHPVGQKKPNGWGLYDMHGNVWQWCLDWYAQDCYSKSSADDPPGPPNGSERVARGGAWKNAWGWSRSGYRYSATPETRYDDLGFRVALAPAQAD